MLLVAPAKALGWPLCLGAGNALVTIRDALARGLHGDVECCCLVGVAFDAAGDGVCENVAAFVGRRDRIVVYLNALAVQGGVTALALWQAINDANGLTEAA